MYRAMKPILSTPAYTNREMQASAGQSRLYLWSHIKGKNIASVVYIDNLFTLMYNATRCMLGTVKF